MQPPDSPESLLLKALEEDHAPSAAREAWLKTARPDQIMPPGVDWLVWLILSGRGWGKTRTGAESSAGFALANPGVRVALVAPTYADGRDVMVEGDSGLRSVIDRRFVDTWNRSLGELILTNGSRFKLFSAEEPERLRGPQHSFAWCDEMAAWKYLQQTWDQLQFGLRLGSHPRVIVTTTPKPRPLIRQLRDDPRTIVTRGSTFDNAANLADSALAQLRSRYSGTRLGRQELDGEVLEDTPGALWTRDMLETARVETVPQLTRVVIGVDPSGSNGETGDLIGIVVAGVDKDGHGYILEDGSERLSPDGWAKKVARLYEKHQADKISCEQNFGGEMCRAVLHAAAPNLPVELVSASRGKHVRAEPIAALFEQGRVSLLGTFPELEDQLCDFTTSGYVGFGSPDRADALVWALTKLMISGGAQGWLDYAREKLEESKAAKTALPVTQHPPQASEGSKSAAPPSGPCYPPRIDHAAPKVRMIAAPTSMEWNSSLKEFRTRPIMMGS